MTRSEKILLGVLALALLVVVLLPRQTPSEVSDLQMSNVPTGSLSGGLRFLTYNAPWRFGPPIGNVLPSSANAQTYPDATSANVWTGSTAEGDVYG